MTMPEAAITPDRIRALGDAYQASRALLSAVELDLFSMLAPGPLDAAGLSARLGLHPRGARDFFDSLVALGLLERHDGRYANTPEAAAFLDRAQPSYIGGGLEGAGRLYHTWGRLTEALRTGEPQAPDARAGGDRWAERYNTPDRVRRVTGAMTGGNRAAMLAVARGFPWAHYRTFIDIGTAAGDLPVQVALAHPHISGGGFDLPPVGPAFAEHVAASGLGERLRFHPGSFLTDPLPTADVLAFAHVLHNWGWETRELLLGKAYAALPPGGALLVLDRLIDDDRRHNTGALLGSLNMLLNGPEAANFTGAECRGWLAAAGFRDITVGHFSGDFGMVVGIK